MNVRFLAARFCLATCSLAVVVSHGSIASAQLSVAQAPPSASERLAQLKKAADTRSAMVSEYKKSYSQLEDTQQKFAATAAENQSLGGNIQKLQNDLFLIGQAIAELNDELATAKGATFGISAEISSLRAQQQQINADIVRSQQQLAAAIIVSRQLATRLRAEETAVRGLRLQAESLRKEWLTLVEPLGGRSNVEQQALVDWLGPRLVADPQDEGALLARALAYRQLGRTDKAIDDLTAVIEVQGVFTTLALAVRGGLLIGQDKDRDGNLDYSQAIKGGNTDHLVHAFRGLARAGKGQFTSAEADFKLAAQLGKGRSVGHRLLALLYSTWPKKGPRDGRKALVAARQAVSLSNSQDWTCLDALAAAEAEAGNFDEAVKQAQAAAALATDENRQQCLDRSKQYELQQPLTLDWK